MFSQQFLHFQRNEIPITSSCFKPFSSVHNIALFSRKFFLVFMVNEEKKISTLPKFLVGPALHRPAEPGLHPEEQLQGAWPAHALYNHGG